MSVTASRDERVIQVYDLVKRELRRRGRNISFPKTTDPRKTYTWRYLGNFVDRVDALGLGQDCLSTIVSAVIAHADEQKMLHRGVAILDHRDLLNVCKVQLEREISNENIIFHSIKRSHDFIRKQAAIADTTISLILSKRANRFGLTNLTAWYKANQVSLNFITVSQTCRKAMGLLPKNELNLFPSTKELIRRRLSIQSNQSLMTQLRDLLGDDMFEG